MNNLLKAAARKHALAHGIATSKWTEEDFSAYVDNNGITERDNLRNTTSAIKAEFAEELETMTARQVAVPPAAPAGAVEAAIQALIAATAQAPAQIDESAVIKLIAKHSNAPRLTTVEIVKQDAVSVTREGVHKDYPVVLAHIAAGVNTAIVGPAGSGKSTMFEQIAADLGKKYYFQGAVQQEHKIMGFIDANGTYHRTPFRDAFEFGGMYVQEEFDGSGARPMLSLNNAAANDQCDFPDGMVKKHPDFVMVMAGNTFGTGASRQYVGRQQLDAATLDRFAFIEVGYDEAMERQAALAVFEGATNWVTEVQAFRKKVEKSGIKHVVSPRASIMGAKLLKQGLSRDVMVKSLLHKGMTADQIAQLTK